MMVDQAEHDLLGEPQAMMYLMLMSGHAELDEKTKEMRRQVTPNHPGKLRGGAKSRSGTRLITD